IRSHQVPADDYNVSEALRRTRDEEVQAISEEAYRGAYQLLADHRDLLDEIAERLLSNEVIERDEIRSIMTQEPVKRPPSREPGELLRPLGPDTAVGKVIEKRGEGLHHVAYRVGDIESTLTGLRDAGVELIDARARTGIRGSRVAFLHPRATGGVLTELVEPA